MAWYFARNGERHGPVEEAEIRRMAAAGDLKPSDYVWNETMGDQWASASTVPGLFDAEKPPALIPLLPRAGAGSGAASVMAAQSGPDAGGVSCSAPVRAAWERMKSMLFRPFDLGKWFTLGVSAWLSALGQGGGVSGIFDSYGRSGDGMPSRVDIDVAVESTREFLSRFGTSLALVGLAIVLVGLAIGLLLAWLRARGKFMFLDNVLNNRAEIAGPWRVFTQHGNSLFLWYVVYGVGCLLMFLALAGLTVLAVVVPFFRAGSFIGSMLPALIGLGLAWLLFIIVTAYISRFVEDFIIPLMYHFDLTAREAWGRFGTLLKPRVGSFLLYGLFYVLLSIAAVICVLLFAVATCCVGGCLMLIPYVGTVVLLPVAVFFRTYSVEYLAQFGREYRLFADAT